MRTLIAINAAPAMYAQSIKLILTCFLSETRNFPTSLGAFFACRFPIGAMFALSHTGFLRTDARTARAFFGRRISAVEMDGMIFCADTWGAS